MLLDGVGVGVENGDFVCVPYTKGIDVCAIRNLYGFYYDDKVYYDNCGKKAFVWLESRRVKANKAFIIINRLVVGNKNLQGYFNRSLEVIQKSNGDKIVKAAKQRMDFYSGWGL